MIGRSIRTGSSICPYAAAKKLGYAETGTARVKVEGIDPAQYWAQRGKPAPLMLNEPPTPQPQVTASTGKIEQWTPPPAQHAPDTVVVPHAAAGASMAGGQYLQVWRFRQPGCGRTVKVQAQRHGQRAGLHQFHRA